MIEANENTMGHTLRWCKASGSSYFQATNVSERREIVTLCGSTRFRDAFLREQKRLTLEGAIVLSVGMFGHLDDDIDIGSNEAPSVLKERLDALHKDKIRLSDSIHVINEGGYIGTSTHAEIDFAQSLGKRVTYMEPS